MAILNQTRKIKNSLNIKIYGEIGNHSWWSENNIVSADDIYKELEEYGKDVDLINVYINSPGGSVSEGCAIYSALKRHKADVHVYIDGRCASIASVIAMAGDKIIMSPVANMMIHNPISALAGDAKEMRHLAGVLDIFKETIINAYVTKSNLTREEISTLMDNTTYFTSKEAIEKGFATEEMHFDIKNSEFSNLDVFKIGQITNINNGGNIENKEGEHMAYKNAQELEAQNKDLVEEIKNKAREEVLAEERKRISELDVLNEKTGGKCKDIIDKAKEEGKTKVDIIENVLENFATAVEDEGEEDPKNVETIKNRVAESNKYQGAGTNPTPTVDNVDKEVTEIVNLMNK